MNATVPSILIIDNDPRNIFALGLILRSRGYSCITAENAAMGIRLLKENTNIAIVLMDMMMQEMDGYEAIALLRKDAVLSRIPIVAVTAQAMPGDLEKCIAAGADAYVSKPVDVDLMIGILNKYL